MAQSLDKVFSKKELAATIKSLDKDGNGKVEFQEFTGAAPPPRSPGCRARSARCQLSLPLQTTG